MERTSEVYLSLLERIEVGKGVVDKVCRQPHCDDRSATTTGSCRAVELSLLLLLLRCRSVPWDGCCWWCFCDTAAQRALRTDDYLLITASRVAVYPVFAFEIEIDGSQLKKQKV